MFSNHKTLFLTLFITLAVAPAAIGQERTAYRVELLVLRHLESAGEPWPAGELPDPAGLMDLAQRAGQQADGTRLPDDPFYLGPPVESLRPPLGPFPDERGPWADVVLIAERSERMQAVWRSLRLSAEFRPEAFIAWEQSADEPFPLVRVHGDEVLVVDDAFAQLRGMQPGYAFQYRLESADFDLAPIPEPVEHYAIDGGVRLRRSRFLHLDLDLGYYQPAPGTWAGIPGPPLLTAHQGYYVNPLKQSRQVRTGRMEYFDSPVLGVLAWITEIEVNEEHVE